MKRTLNVGKMARLAVLIAILLVMNFTPLGFIQIPPLAITLMMLPVGIAAVIVGPLGGAVMGTLFGLTSFLQCVGVGTPAVGLKLYFFNIHPLLTFLWCVVPRLLAGWLPGLVFAALSKTKSPKTVSAVVSCGLASALNTIFYMFTLWALFTVTGETQKLLDSYSSASFFVILLAVIVTNTLLELAANTVIGGAISRALLRFLPAKKAAQRGI
jgi:uncharacterized membrane protein